MPNEFTENNLRRRWKYWGNGSFEYPAFKFDFVNDKEFNHERVVSLEEFNTIGRRIQITAGRPIKIIK